MKISFELFRRIYEKIKKKDSSHTLFYYSLFDPSSYETILADIPELHTKIEKEIDEIVPKLFKDVNRKIWKEKIKGREEKFLRSFVYSDDLCKFILCCEMRDKGIKSKIDKRFGDLLVNNTIFEIKRLVSGTQLQAILNDIIEKFNESKFRSFHLVLLLIFPQVEKENTQRVSKLIEVYYFLEEYLRKSLKNENRKIKVLCQYITKENLSPYNLGAFVQKVCKLYRDLRSNKPI